jgi:phosphomevalonate kinase
LHWQVIFSGKSAGTKDHIASFDAWRQKANNTPLDHLVKASTALCAKPPRLAELAHYCEVLKSFDAAANLNIFTHEHTRLGTLAAASGVLYKPCGAGGGDIGIGFSDDPDALAVFRQRAAENGFLPLDLEMASHGVALEHG